MSDAINKICAVMDAQGFIMDEKFYPREIAVISHTFKQSVICDTNLMYSYMNLKDRVTNKYISNKLLGMSLGSYNTDIKANVTDDGYQLILNLYEKVKTEKRPYLAIKNKQLASILDYWGILYINLEDYGCHKIINVINNCYYHERGVPDRRKLLCAEQKCVMLWKWLINFWTLTNKPI